VSVFAGARDKRGDNNTAKIIKWRCNCCRYASCPVSPPLIYPSVPWNATLAPATTLSILLAESLTEDLFTLAEYCAWQCGVHCPHSFVCLLPVSMSEGECVWYIRFRGVSVSCVTGHKTWCLYCVCLLADCGCLGACVRSHLISLHFTILLPIHSVCAISVVCDFVKTELTHRKPISAGSLIGDQWQLNSSVGTPHITHSHRARTCQLASRVHIYLPHLSCL